MTRKPSFTGLKAARDNRTSPVIKGSGWQNVKPRLGPKRGELKRTVTVSIPELIAAGYLPAGFTIPPSVTIVRNRAGWETGRIVNDTSAAMLQLAGAKAAYAARTHKTEPDPQIKADTAEEIRIGVKTRDAYNQARSRRGKK